MSFWTPCCRGGGAGGGDLAISDRGVPACVGRQDSPEGPAAAAVHDRVAWEGAVQVLFNLGVPILAALQAGGTEVLAMVSCIIINKVLTGGNIASLHIITTALAMVSCILCRISAYYSI